MEVASILSSNKNIECLFLKYLLKNKFLLFSTVNDDTYYFLNIETKKNELYFHTNNDIKKEYYNFSAKDLNYINNFFSDKDFVLIDISFKNHIFFKKLIEDFCLNVITGTQIDDSKILIDDPFIGLLMYSNGKFEEINSS